MADIRRPLWSVMIPVYNCSMFLPDALESVLQQDPGAEVMQIEVIDDYSTDSNVEKIVKRIGKGRIGYYQQESNVGSLRNFETCINRANGYYVHLLHGDDKVKHGFYSNLAELFIRYPEAGAAFSAWNIIDEESNILRRSDIEEGKSCILNDWLNRIAEHPRIQYVAIAVKREVYEALGSFYGVIYGEDWEMWARIAKNYSTAYTPELLAEYREHNNSISGRSFLTGRNIHDIAKVIQTINKYVLEKDRKRMNHLAQKYYTYWAFDFTKNLWLKTRNKNIVINQTREILKIHRDAKLVLKVFKLLLLVCLYSFKRTSKNR